MLTVDIYYLDAFKETQHPRGQPENAGEFAKKDGPTTRAHAQTVGKAPGEHETEHLKRAQGLLIHPSKNKTDRPYHTAINAELLKRSLSPAALAKIKEVVKRPTPVAPQQPAKAVTPPTPPPKISSSNPTTIAAFTAATKMGEQLKKALPGTIKHVQVYVPKQDPDDVWMIASNQVGPRGNPQTTPGAPGVTGVAVRFSREQNRAWFYEITSNEKGAGGKMVDAVLKAAPSYNYDVHIDLSGGFWEHMVRRYPNRFEQR